MVFVANKGYSQKYMDEIATETCNCLTILSDTISTERFTMELGFCMINASKPHKKKIKRDFNIDMDNLNGKGEKLGEVIGMKMSTICPKSLIKVALELEEKVEAESLIEGTITKVENDDFVVLSLKDERGKSTKYYWLTFVESEFDLVEDYSLLVGKSVMITYTSLEIFDPKIEEYRFIFIMNKIELID